MKNNKLDYREFNVNGYYYQKTIEGKETNFRKYLEIYHGSIKPKKLDLMVIMMNPGGSHPIKGFKGNYNKPVDIKPDSTQNYIMKFMYNTGLKYARILNLSDYCNKKSSDFYPMISKLDKEYIGHSIFHKSRKDDFDDFFIPRVPVIVAWGVKSKLQVLAENAFNKIDKKRIIGLKKEGSTFGYYHPMRRVDKYHSKSWIEEIMIEWKKNIRSIINSYTSSKI